MDDLYIKILELSRHPKVSKLLDPYLPFSFLPTCIILLDLRLDELETEQFSLQPLLFGLHTLAGRAGGAAIVAAPSAAPLYPGLRLVMQGEPGE